VRSSAVIVSASGSPSHGAIVVGSNGQPVCDKHAGWSRSTGSLETPDADAHVDFSHDIAADVVCDSVRVASEVARFCPDVSTDAFTAEVSLSSDATQLTLHETATTKETLRYRQCELIESTPS
jgi:hypothetical protein